MEEVDRILIQSLRDIGCQIDDSLQNVNEFNVNTLFGCVSQCLQLITGNKELPTRSPPNISTRFKVDGELAQLCQSNGYKSNIGYQTFLSINELETRKLLNFLIEKVLREVAVTVSSSTLNSWETLEQILSNKITTHLSDSTWISQDLVNDLCNIAIYHPAASFVRKLIIVELLTMTFHKRLHFQYRELLKDPAPLCYAEPQDLQKDIAHWTGYIDGPEQTPYADGRFHLTIEFTSDYPFKPPHVRFITPIYHPNISIKGEICLDILHSQWSPALSIRALLISICSLLTDPNLDHGLNREALLCYQKDEKKYQEIAKEWTRKYASN